MDGAVWRLMHGERATSRSRIITRQIGPARQFLLIWVVLPVASGHFRSPTVHSRPNAAPPEAVLNHRAAQVVLA